MTLQTFPDWSDLGNTSFSRETQFLWGGMLAHIEKCRYYFDGDVFTEKVLEEEGLEPEDDAPLLYPVQMNLVKMLCLSQTDATFGEYEELPFIFSARQDEERTSSDEKAIDLMHDIVAGSNAGATFWELELDRNVYGGGALKVEPSNRKPSYIKITRVPRFSFFPIWDPENPDELLETYVITVVTREQAAIKYGYETSKDFIYRVEHWTQKTYKNTIDDHEIKIYSGINPWGIVPFVYIPRFRFSNWWGDDLTGDVIGPQNELNMRVADIGEAINYNAHPTRWGLNLPRGFDEKNFPIGSNSMWDLGRTMSSQFEPKVGMLESQHAVNPEVYQYVDFVYDWARTSNFAPPIAFGEDRGGGQRSGITLEIRMWPLIKSITRSRNYLRAGINRMMDIIARIYNQKQYPGIPIGAVKSIEQRRIVPSFNSVLPQDHQRIVDEVNKLLSMTPPAISLESAQRILGRGSGEVLRIKTMLQDEELFPPEPDPETEPSEPETTVD